MRHQSILNFYGLRPTAVAILSLLRNAQVKESGKGKIKYPWLAEFVFDETFVMTKLTEHVTTSAYNHDPSAYVKSIPDSTPSYLRLADKQGKSLKQIVFEIIVIDVNRGATTKRTYAKNDARKEAGTLVSENNKSKCHICQTGSERMIPINSVGCWSCTRGKLRKHPGVVQLDNGMHALENSYYDQSSSDPRLNREAVMINLNTEMTPINFPLLALCLAAGKYNSLEEYLAAYVAMETARIDLHGQQQKKRRKRAEKKDTATRESFENSNVQALHTPLTKNEITDGVDEIKRLVVACKDLSSHAMISVNKSSSKAGF